MPSDLIRLRQARDGMDREYAEPLDVSALAHTALMSSVSSAMAELLAKGMLRAVIFATDDCDVTFEHIRASGAQVLQEPMDQPYGVRDCAFLDPAGNMLRFNQPR